MLLLPLSEVLKVKNTKIPPSDVTSGYAQTSARKIENEEEREREIKSGRVNAV